MQKNIHKGGEKMQTHNKISQLVLDEKASQIGVKIIERFVDKDKRTKLRIVSLLHPEKGERIVEQYNFLNHTTKCWYFNENSSKEDLLKNSEISSAVDIIGNYVNNGTKTLCRCKTCGNEWYISPNKLLKGRRCPKCAAQKAHERNKKKHETFVEELSKANPCLTVLGEYYNCRTMIEYKCSICGKISRSTPQRLLRNESGCHFCKSSVGEQKIFSLLNKYKINFEKEKCFADCKDRQMLPFDFYLKDYNVCIEFQGEQHYRSVDFSYTPTKESKKKAEKKFVEIQKRDKIKKEYCKNKGIKLLLITYKQIKQIESILIKELNLSTVTTAGCSQ